MGGGRFIYGTRRWARLGLGLIGLGLVGLGLGRVGCRGARGGVGWGGFFFAAGDKRLSMKAYE